MERMDIEAQLARLTARLYRIEQRLGLPAITADEQTERAAPEVEPKSPPVVAAALERKRQAKPVAPTTLSEAKSASGGPTTPAAPPTTTAEPAAASPTPPPVPSTAASPVIAPPPMQPTLARTGSAAARFGQPTARPARKRAPLELLVGGKFAAWAGSIVVIFAAAFFVKLAYDKGFFDLIGPLGKCLIAAAFGGLLIAAGEVIYRRIGRVASGGPFAAGLGTLYLTAYASFQYFDLVDESGAFFLLALVALLGFGLTIRAKLLTIGVLSIVGAYLTPVLLSGASTFAAALPMYLTMILGVSLALSAYKPVPFRPLRYVAIGGLGVIGLLWALSAGNAQWQLVLVFCSIWWVLVTGEALLAALRNTSPIGNAVASLLATAWYVTIGGWVIAGAQGSGFNYLGVYTGAIGLLAGAIAFQFGPGVDALRGRAQRAIGKLAVALWVQAGALVTIAIALHFDGYGQALGWMILAVASIEVGRRLPSRGVDIFGLIVGALATARVVLIDSWLNPSLAVSLTTVGDITITHWSIVALVTVIGTHVAAQRLRSRGLRPWKTMPAVLAAIGTLQWMALWAAHDLGLLMTAGWLLGAAVLLESHRIGRRERYVELAIGVLVFATGKWLLFDALLPRLDPAWNAAAATPIANWQMAVAAVMVALGWRVSRIMLRRGKAESAPIGTAWQAVVLVGVVFSLIAASFEVDRVVESIAAGAVTWSPGYVRQLLFTMLWTMGALGVGLFSAMSTRSGRSGDAAARFAPLDRFAWGLLAICAMKWAVVDCLYEALVKEAVAPSFTPIVNLQMLAAVVVIGSAMALFAVHQRRGGLTSLDEAEPWNAGAHWIPAAGAVLLLWGLSFEVDRFISLEEGVGSTFPWTATHHRMLWWTLLWTAGAAVLAAISRWRRSPVGEALATTGLVLAVAAGLAYVTLDTLVPRVLDAPGQSAVILNLQFMTGAVCAVVLGVHIRLLRTSPNGNPDRQRMYRHAVIVSAALIGAIGLWLGSFEIDRFCALATDRFDRPDMARHTGLSVYWAVYAIGLVAAGFWRRSPWMRYVGLALLAITLGKVMILDMAEVESIYRVLSLLGVGVLLIVTSVAYFRFAPRLTGSERTDDDRALADDTDAMA
ncbi:MAG: DUF2339 domain-containing protein [Phycisphaerales bacterium]|nr:DUF2339 domain-containing protein [Phycisphaerales bacterium]